VNSELTEFTKLFNIDGDNLYIRFNYSKDNVRCKLTGQELYSRMSEYLSEPDNMHLDWAMEIGLFSDGVVTFNMINDWTMPDKLISEINENSKKLNHRIVITHSWRS